MKTKRIICILSVIAIIGIFLCSCGKKTSESSVQKPAVDFNVEVIELFVNQESSVPYTVSGDIQLENLVFTSSNEEIVTLTWTSTEVSISAVGIGQTEIVAYLEEEYISSISVNVKEYPLSVLVPEGKLVLRRNRTVSVTAYMESGIQYENVEWITSDPTVATVEYQGLKARVTSMARGECEITVKAGDFSCSFTVIVGIT